MERAKGREEGGREKLTLRVENLGCMGLRFLDDDAPGVLSDELVVGSRREGWIPRLLVTLGGGAEEVDELAWREEGKRRRKPGSALKLFSYRAPRIYNHLTH